MSCSLSLDMAIQTRTRRNPPPSVLLIGVALLVVLTGTNASFLRGGSSSSSSSSSSSQPLSLLNHFPTLDETFEMSSLSLLVYAYRHETNASAVCDAVHNSSSYSCHYYHHDWEIGTQVLLLSTEYFVAIIFAGTDDLTTSLTDVDILMAEYGDETVQLPDPRVRIHKGFEDSVFSRQIYKNLLVEFAQVRQQKPTARLYTTGHSLGGADAILTAIALTLQGEAVTCISFGCPRMGNSYWRDFVHLNPVVKHVAVWRVVLGWDLVPRLPEFMLHVGHTIQLDVNHSDTNSFDATASVYYQHYGDVEKGWAGVPFGWSSKPFIWVPGALESHHMHRYWAALSNWTQSDLPWINEFVTVSPVTDDAPMPHVDDDFYINPPDDEFEGFEEDAALAPRF